MKICNGPENQTTRRILLVACVPALAAAFTVALPQSAHAHRVTPPPVPGDIQAPAGSKAFLEGHAVGTQNYICLPSGTGFAWTFFGPQATLFNDDYEQVITHFLSPNPFEGGTPRATWQHSRDTSTVWALSSIPSSDPPSSRRVRFPGSCFRWWDARRAHGWPQADGDHFIQRVNTSGGIAPATGCAVATDVGKKVLVPYTADYFFYKDRGGHDSDDDN